MNVLICYEVSGKQEEVRNELLSKGYMTNWKVQRGRDKITYHLPAPLLLKKGENFTPTKAKEELKKIAKQLGVQVLRALALSVAGKWDGLVGTPHSGNSTSATEKIHEHVAEEQNS